MSPRQREIEACWLKVARMRTNKKLKRKRIIIKNRCKICLKSLQMKQKYYKNGNQRQNYKENRMNMLK